MKKEEIKCKRCGEVLNPKKVKCLEQTKNKKKEISFFLENYKLEYLTFVFAHLSYEKKTPE